MANPTAVLTTSEGSFTVELFVDKMPGTAGNFVSLAKSGFLHNAHLDWFSPGASKHPVFGAVTEGMEVVEAIGSASTGPNDRPSEPIQMISIRVQE